MLEIVTKVGKVWEIHTKVVKVLEIHAKVVKVLEIHTKVVKVLEILTKVVKMLEILTKVGKVLEILTKVGKVLEILTKVIKVLEILTKVVKVLEILTKVGKVLEIVIKVDKEALGARVMDNRQIAALVTIREPINKTVIPDNTLDINKVNMEISLKVSQVGIRVVVIEGVGEMIGAGHRIIKGKEAGLIKAGADLGVEVKAGVNLIRIAGTEMFRIAMGTIVEEWEM